MPRSAPVGYYESLDFNSPMTDETANALVAELAAANPQRVLDIGCGWGELLLRLLAACPDATGHGIDTDEVLVARAEANASDRGLADRVTFGPRIEAAEVADLVLSVGAEHVFGDHADALAGLWDLTEPGGRVLFATQFWEQPPTDALQEALGQLPTLAELVARSAGSGWRPLGLTVSSARDWDHFEFGFLADWEQFVMHPPDSEGATAAARAADAHRHSYLERRGMLGFAFLTLGRPPKA